MQRQAVQRGKLGLILLVTAVIVAAVLIVPNIARAVTATLVTDKSSYKVGETVVLTATIDVDTDTLGTSTLLSITGGPESVSVNIPISGGVQILTSELPVDGATGESGTLIVTSILTELGPAPGGYAQGYTGSFANAEIAMTIEWTPPVEQDGGGATTAGSYSATITANGSPSSPALFTIVELTSVTITVTRSDGTATDTPAIDISGDVDDPTVGIVSVGVTLPEIVLFGNDGFTGPNTVETAGEQALFSFTQNSSPPDPGSSLWHVMTNFSSCSVVTPEDGVISLAYTEDSDCNYEAATDDPVFGSAGNVDSASFVVGENTEISFLTWYNTEPGVEFDKKLIQLVGGGTATTIAQITSEPPPSDPFDPFSTPDFTAPPGTVYTNTFLAPHPLVFVPPPFFLPDPTDWTAIVLDLSIIEDLLGLDPGFFEGETVSLRFRFETGDSVSNNFEGWFVDEVQVKGAGAGTAVDLVVDQDNLTFASSGTPFTLSEGSNVFTLTAINGYPTPLIGIKIITVIFDTSDPEVTLDSLVAITSNATIAISGSFVDDTPFELQVAFDLDNDGILESTDKIVLSDKTFTTDTTFSIVATLSEGTNRILAKLTDKVDRTNTTEAFVLLDTVDPVLTVLPVIYPVGEVSARAGDPIVFQVNATDAASGVGTVVFFPPGAEDPEELLPIADIPGAVQDQWQVDPTATHVLPVVVPAGVPAGPFSLNVRVTDNAGNFPSPDGTVIGTITAALQAFNIYLQPGANLVSTPLIASDTAWTVLMTQTVPNVDPTFKNNLAPFAGGDPSLERDASDNATLANVITKITYYTGGSEATAGTPPDLATPGTFPEFTPGTAFDSLTTLDVGKGYWITTDEDAFKESAPLADGLPNTRASIKLTIFGTFLVPGTVPPVFPVIQEWNLIGLHSEQPRNVGNMLDSLVFSASGAKAWSSLLEFLNLIEFNFELAEGESEESRVTITQGQFNSLDSTDTGSLGRGFWLFFLETTGSITP